MKRVCVILLVMLLCLSLAACRGGKADDAAASPDSSKPETGSTGIASPGSLMPGNGSTETASPGNLAPLTERPASPADLEAFARVEIPGTRG